MFPKFLVSLLIVLSISSLTPISNPIAKIFTASKRSLGLGNVFTPVCHSVHRWGWLPSMHHRSHHQGGLHPWGSASREGLGRHPSTSEYGQQAGDTHPTGMYSCFWNTLTSEFRHVVAGNRIINMATAQVVGIE